MSHHTILVYADGHIVKRTLIPILPNVRVTEYLPPEDLVSQREERPTFRERNFRIFAHGRYPGQEVEEFWYREQA